MRTEDDAEFIAQLKMLCGRDRGSVLLTEVMLQRLITLAEERGSWAKRWHACTEVILVMLALTPALGSDEAPRFVQDKLSGLEAARPSSAVVKLLQILKVDWWPERSLNSDDFGERRLLAALILAFPEEIHTRERCAKDGCGEDAFGCDECLSDGDVPDLLKRAEQILEARTPS